MTLPLGTVLYESGGRQAYVYFPTKGIVSLLYVLADGASAEIAVAGREGLVGVLLFMGGGTMPSRAVVQSAGHAYRLSAKAMKKQFDRGGELHHLVLLYGRQAAGRRADRVPPWPHQGARPAGDRGASMRVLRGGEERVRPIVAAVRRPCLSALRRCRRASEGTKARRERASASRSR